MLNLFKFDYGALFEALESQGINFWSVISVANQTDPPKSASSQSRQNVEIVQIELSTLLALNSILYFCRTFIIMYYKKSTKFELVPINNKRKLKEKKQKSSKNVSVSNNKER